MKSRIITLFVAMVMVVSALPAFATSYTPKFELNQNSKTASDFVENALAIISTEKKLRQIDIKELEKSRLLESDLSKLKEIPYKIADLNDEIDKLEELFKILRFFTKSKPVKFILKKQNIVNLSNTEKAYSQTANLINTLIVREVDLQKTAYQQVEEILNSNSFTNNVEFENYQSDIALRSIAILRLIKGLKVLEQNRRTEIHYSFY